MSRFDELLNGYLHDSLNHSELEEFFALVKQNPGLLDEVVVRETGFEQKHAGLTDRVQRERMLANILTRDQAEEGRVVRLRGRNVTRRWYAAAAVFILLGASGLYLLRQKKTEAPVAKTLEYKNDVAPGRTGAVLQLADGSKVTLDSLGNGVVAQQGNAKVVRHQNGGLAYETTGNDVVVLYNKLMTGKGKQFQVILPDGTRVWLNSSSSLRYPTSFGGKQREVEMTGEAYFEVARNAARPFVVKTGKEAVTVLGTHFNINSYEDEPVKRTTLLEGSVRVSGPAGKALLIPGEEAAVYHSDGAAARISVATVNAEDAVAWKNGFFNFDNADLHTVMRQLVRWYDVDVLYDGPVPGWGDFKGKIGRDLTLAQVLRILEQSGVHFRIEEDKRIVIFR